MPLFVSSDSNVRVMKRDICKKIYDDDREKLMQFELNSEDPNPEAKIVKLFLSVIVSETQHILNVLPISEVAERVKEQSIPGHVACAIVNLVLLVGAGFAFYGTNLINQIPDQLELLPKLPGGNETTSISSGNETVQLMPRDRYDGPQENPNDDRDIGFASSIVGDIVLSVVILASVVGQSVACLGGCDDDKAKLKYDSSKLKKLGEKLNVIAGVLGDDFKVTVPTDNKVTFDEARKYAVDIKNKANKILTSVDLHLKTQEKSTLLYQASSKITDDQLGEISRALGYVKAAKTSYGTNSSAHYTKTVN